MSQWFDILYRRQQNSENKTSQSTSASIRAKQDKNVENYAWFDALYRQQHNKSKTIESTPSNSEEIFDSSLRKPSSASHLKLEHTTPIAEMPRRWAIEIQKIASHLRQNKNNTKKQLNIIFSGVQNEAGVSTICYLIAHHFATEGHDQRVLYVNFDQASSAPHVQSANTNLVVGEQLSADDAYLSVNSTLTTVSIRKEDAQSASTASRWLNAFIANTNNHFDLVLIDAPPFFTCPESYSIAKACDGVVLVLRSGETRYTALNSLVSELDSMGINIIGTVLNFRQYHLPSWLLKYV